MSTSLDAARRHGAQLTRTSWRCCSRRSSIAPRASSGWTAGSTPPARAWSPIPGVASPRRRSPCRCSRGAIAEWNLAQLGGSTDCDDDLVSAWGDLTTEQSAVMLNALEEGWLNRVIYDYNFRVNGRRIGD